MVQQSSHRRCTRSRHRPWLHQALIFGGVEIYHSSSRPDTVRAYLFHAKNREGKIIEPGSERYVETSKTDSSETVYNQTPIIIVAYSGMAVPIAAVVNERLPRSLEVQVTIQGLFGKKYSETLAVDTKLGFESDV